MTKKKGWQLALIVAVIGLTIYNILPTLFFYTKPLHSPIEEKEANEISLAIANRVNALEQDALEWVASFNKLLGIKAESIQIVPNSPDLIEVRFKQKTDLEAFKKHLPRAGALIAFYPSQLSLAKESVIPDSLELSVQESNTLFLQRKVPVHFDKETLSQSFHYGKLFDEAGKVSPAYWSILKDRLSQVALSVAGPSENAALVTLALESKNDPRGEEFLYKIAQTITNIDAVFGQESKIARSFYRTFTQGTFNETRETVVASLTEALTAYKDKVQLQKLSQDLEKDFFEAKEELLLKAITILRSEKSAFANGQEGWVLGNIYEKIDDQTLSDSSKDASIETSSYNPLIQSIGINWEAKTFQLTLNNDIVRLRDSFANDSENKGRFEGIQQMIYNEIARISFDTEEVLTPLTSSFTIAFQDLEESKSFIALELSQIAKKSVERTLQMVQETWNPSSEDLKRESYPIVDWNAYQTLPASEKQLKLVVYAPILTDKPPLTGFKTNSIYVIAKDLGKIIKKVSKDPNSESSQKTSQDFESLYKLLQSSGFVGYPGSTYPLSAAFADDYVFEASDFYNPVLQATREDFHLHGSKKVALLELSDLRQRIVTLNQIETSIHEDLLKWRDEYHAAQVDPTLRSYFDVPKPTKNALWSNFVLSSKKYFRGDEKKILQWGLDLSGGKSVEIALKDSNQKTVTGDAEIKQGINELYNRINKMGVSDVSIRREGSNITIDFPGSQQVSASELIKASLMTFNIVNETFSADNGRLYREEVNRFLQEVWNEAVVTNRKDSTNLHRIAFSHLYGDSLNPETAQPRTDAAKFLFSKGLRLADPDNLKISNTFDTTESMITMYRGDSFTNWHGQTHPLLIVFKNFALEGSNLENVRIGYDPAKGNFLSFGIKNSMVLPSGEKISPRKTLFNWTQVFAKDKVIGSIYENAANGHGWRMAVILNGFVVSAPALEAALKDSGVITGHFTQRELAKLSADLKAGSLSFTPEILSEKSITPDLGLKERTDGITATVIALIAVIVVMVTYYRFGGVIASIAVLLNLFIIWAALQNIGSVITLANLAGVILTVGMAVDANVLVFERIREEFAKTGKLAQAVMSGYQKAFSAIFDSNITTVIAALILLNFDSGPIKGFAITLIIGIVSSMFTALFMTKYFFMHWVQNPKHKMLKMANFIQPKNWDFLKWGKLALIVSTLLIVVGGAALASKKGTIFGMDFTGGYTVTTLLEKQREGDYRKRIEQALLNSGASSQDIQVRELSSPNMVRIFLGKSMLEQGKPFAGMPLEVEIDHPLFGYETNPKLVWLVNALEKGGLTLSEKAKSEIDQNWKSVSGQMSDTMRHNAILGLALALIAILIYITFRFEFTYAISATIGVLFDLLLTVALVGILHYISVPIQIDLNAVGALMTIAGYSLNDTIIVFDRVREDAKHMPKSSFKDVINHALNVTLSRTLLTSGTTLVVLLALVFLGGSSIFGFSLIMTIGVVIGTLSTFFIATLLLLYFQKKEHKRGKNHVALNGA